MILICAAMFIFVSVGIPIIYMYRDLCFDFDPRCLRGGGVKEIKFSKSFYSAIRQSESQSERRMNIKKICVGEYRVMYVYMYIYMYICRTDIFCFYYICKYTCLLGQWVLDSWLQASRTVSDGRLWAQTRLHLCPHSIQVLFIKKKERRKNSTLFTEM